jgi:hypothetical protein
MGRKIMIMWIYKREGKATWEKGGNEIKVQKVNGKNGIKLQKKDEGKERGMMKGWKRRRDGMPIREKGRR